MANLFDTAAITYADKEACARRELEYRRRVYPRWVATGKMQQTEADRQIEVMSAIVDDYRKCREIADSGRDRLP